MLQNVTQIEFVFYFIIPGCENQGLYSSRCVLGETGDAKRNQRSFERLDGAAKSLLERMFCCISQRGRGVYKFWFSPDVLPDVDGRELVDDHVIYINSLSKTRKYPFC
jgi:hypothetical protein